MDRAANIVCDLCCDVHGHSVTNSMRSLFALVAVVLLRGTAVGVTSTQADIDKFVGEWAVTIQYVKQEDTHLTVTVRREDGVLAGDFADASGGNGQSTKEVAMEGATLRLRFLQTTTKGRTIETVISMTPSDQLMNVTFDVEQGRLRANGTAVRK
jgi:hypothetical protein